MEISKMLTVSTSNIRPDTAFRLLKSLKDEDSAIELCVYAKMGYGYFIHIPEDLEEREIPDDLADCLKLATDNECEWLCIDCDGDVGDNLPVYDWQNI